MKKYERPDREWEEETDSDGVWFWGVICFILMNVSFYWIFCC